MINLKDLIKAPDQYRTDMNRRGKDGTVVDTLISTYQERTSKQQAFEASRKKQNDFNKTLWSLSPEERTRALEEMKSISKQTKELQTEADEIKSTMDTLIKKVPNLMASETPTGKSDHDNPVIEIFGEKQRFDFEPRPYRELPVYKEYVSQEAWAKAMWSRGYYLRGEMARFQKVLMDYALDYITSQWYEMMYVPLMLNADVLTGTWHLPDFDGQQYEVGITDTTNYYLIWSSEPSIMGYYMNENVWNLKEPILVTCLSSCFRKEAGSYGKDQQGILRVHQFEKVEMVVICRPEDTEECFAKQTANNEYIFNSLWLYYEKVEVCSWDLPGKHYRQQDYNAWFPAVELYRELCSNGNASDYQNRGLNIKYTTDDGKKATPRGLNDTWMTFRTWLAIMEQFQQADGRVKLPQVLVERFGKEYLG